MGVPTTGTSGLSVASENHIPAVEDAPSQLASPRTLRLTDSQFISLPVDAAIPGTVKVAEAPGWRSPASGAARSTTGCGFVGSLDEAVTVTTERTPSASGSWGPGETSFCALGIGVRPVLVIRTTAPVPSSLGARS